MKKIITKIKNIHWLDWAALAIAIFIVAGLALAIIGIKWFLFRPKLVGEISQAASTSTLVVGVKPLLMMSMPDRVSMEFFRISNDKGDNILQVNCADGIILLRGRPIARDAELAKICAEIREQQKIKHS